MAKPHVQKPLMHTLKVDELQGIRVIPLIKLLLQKRETTKGHTLGEASMTPSPRGKHEAENGE